MDLQFTQARLKKLNSPKFLVTLLCVASSIYVIKPNAITIFILILFCSVNCFMSIFRYINKTIHISLLFSEIIGSVTFSCLYLVLYHKTISSDNEINILLIMCSLVLLLPFIIEIAQNEKK